MAELYSKKYNYVVKYYPKSGCSTLKFLFRECHSEEIPEKNKDSLRFSKFFKKIPNCKPIFSLIIVRNPYSRIVSTFTDKVCGRHNHVGQKISLPKVTFFHFVHFLLRLHRQKKRFQKIDFHLIRQDHNYLKTDIIVKLENLKNELIKNYQNSQTQDLVPIIENSLVNKVNVTNKDKSKTNFVGMTEYSLNFSGPWSYFKYFYNDEIKGMVDEIYDNEFKIFGYPKVI